MTAADVKAQFRSVLDDVATGEQIDITVRGRVVARLVPASGPNVLRGRMSDEAMSAASDDELFATDGRWT